MTHAHRPRALIQMAPSVFAEQFGPRQMTRLQELADLVRPVAVADPVRDCPDELSAVEVLITGWGATPLTVESLDRMPHLRAVLHCAGSVRALLPPQAWGRDLVVSTGADLNAEPFARFAAAAIVLAAKKAFVLGAGARRHRGDWSYRDQHGSRSTTELTVGIVGFSRIGRRVVRHLTNLLDARILVHDPYADASEVLAEGAELVALPELLPAVGVLSLHVPQLPETRHMIGAAELAALPDHATVINTARGSVIDTTALECECVAGRLYAVLDVTDPEPLPADSPLYDCPGVLITPHISGSIDAEVHLMADGALDELAALIAGRPLARALSREEAAISA